MLIHFITVTIIINIIIVLIFVYLLLVVLMRGRERFHNSGGMCVVEFESNFLLFFDYFSRTIDDTNCKYFCSVSVTFKTSHSNSQLFSILFISVNYIFFRSSLIFFLRTWPARSWLPWVRMPFKPVFFLDQSCPDIFIRSSNISSFILYIHL